MQPAMINFSGRKPPRHPNRVSLRPWIARHLRPARQEIRGASTAFVNAVKNEHDLPATDFPIDPDFVLDLAEAVLAKFRSTPPHARRHYDSSLFPEDDDDPFYLSNVTGKTFALAVLAACKVENRWWTLDFTDDLVNVVFLKAEAAAAAAAAVAAAAAAEKEKEKEEAAAAEKEKEEAAAAAAAKAAVEEEEVAAEKEIKRSPPVSVDQRLLPFKKRKFS